MLARRLQRRHNIKTTLCQCLVLAGYRPTVMLTWLSMLADRLLRWASIHPTLVQCLLFRQLHPVTRIGGRGIAGGGPTSQMLGQH